MSNMIVLNGKGHYIDGVLDAAASPGEMVELAADGNWDPLAATQAEALKGAAGFVIVVEDYLQGKTVNDAYASGDFAQFYQPVRGDKIQVLVKDGETIAVADKLVPEGGGSGLFVEAAGTETRYLLQALEAVSPSGANGLVECRVIS